MIVAQITLETIKSLEMIDHPAPVALAYTLIARHLIKKGFTEDQLSRLTMASIQKH
jgi:hypothetical protein